MAEGQWRTIRGRHVYIKNGDDLKKAFEDKKKYIEEHRQNVRNRVNEAYMGYKKADELYGLRNSVHNKQDYKYNYHTGIDTYKIKEELTPDEAVYYKRVSPRKNEKTEGDRYTPVRTVTGRYKIDQDLDSAKYAQSSLLYDKDEEGRYKYGSYSYDKSGRRELASGFRESLAKSGLPENKYNDFAYRAKQASAGNWKSDSDRKEKLEKLNTDINNYYRNNPVKEDSLATGVKKLDYRIMDPALQNLQEESYWLNKAKEVKQPYSYDEIMSWKYKENPKTAKEVYMNKMQSRLTSIEDAKDNAREFAESKIIYNDPENYIVTGVVGDKNSEHFLSEYKNSKYTGWRKNASVSLEDDMLWNREKPKTYAEWESGDTRDGSKYSEFANDVKNVIKVSEDFNKNNEVATKGWNGVFPEEKPYKVKTNSQLVKDLIARGYRPETAEKMAQQMLKKKKRK